MTEFCIERFISLLQTAPEKRPLLEPPKYSAYLQEHVFDSLTERGYFDLSALDWGRRPAVPSGHGGLR